MTHDPEAAWPLTDTETGYYPGPAPAPALPPSVLVPYQSSSYPVTPKSTNKTISAGTRIAYLAIIIGAAIPLTAIAVNEGGLPGLVVSWIGIVLVATAVFRGK